MAILLQKSSFFLTKYTEILYKVPKNYFSISCLDLGGASIQRDERVRFIEEVRELFKDILGQTIKLTIFKCSLFFNFNFSNFFVILAAKKSLWKGVPGHEIWLFARLRRRRRNRLRSKFEKNFILANAETQTNVPQF